MNSIYISLDVKGRTTPIDLLAIKGITTFSTPRNTFEKEGLIFKVEGAGFHFEFGIKNRTLYIERNGFKGSIKLEEIPERVKSVKIYFGWALKNIVLGCYEGETEIKKVDIETNPCSPPTSLITWARKQNLIPILEYENEIKFVEMVYSSLKLIQRKIEETGVQAFWDFQRKDGKIVSREPKRETDIHPTIHLLLLDQMLQANIEVIPENKLGVGDLDFLFSGILKGGERVHLCAEFKNLHSKDLFHGLEKQLPVYMRNKNADYGAYCVISYKGDWFDKPKKSLKEIELEIIKQKLESSNPLIKEGIRHFIYDVSKQKTASER